MNEQKCEACGCAPGPSGLHLSNGELVCEYCELPRRPPKVCPVCGKLVKIYESARVLCTGIDCEFEWFYEPKVTIPKESQLPAVNIERLKQPGLRNTEIACYLLGWQGGTVFQVARELGLPVITILKAKDIRGLLQAVAEYEPS